MDIKEQIEKLRAAIEKDESEKQKHEYQLKNIAELQKKEKETVGKISRLQEKLKSIETEIVANLNIKFEYSDDLAIEAAKDTLAKLEKENANT